MLIASRKKREANAIRFSRLGLVVLSLLALVPPGPSLAMGRSRPSEPVAPINGSFAKFRLMWNSDASTSATIGWASGSTPGASQKLHYDTVDHGTDAAAYRFSRVVDAKNTSFGMNNAFVRLSGLEPATKYYFVVSEGSNVSERYWFRTSAADASERLSIIAGGDSRNNRTPRKNANLLVSKLRPDAVLFGGDMTNSGTNGEWQEWMDDWQLTTASDGRMTPLVITRGNHESSNDILVKLFDTPTSVYYTTSIGGNLLRTYTLNTESSIAGTQSDWLKQDLASSANVTWKVAQYHRPMRPHITGKSDGTNQYKYWAPLFEQYGMDLVVECDSHTVKQTWPIRASTASGSTDGFIRDDARGVVYVGEGGWGAPLRANDKIRPWTRDSAKFNHFQWFFVSPQELELRTVRVDNAASVSALTDDTRFTLPKGLDVWSPSNGSVLKLAK